MKDLNSQINSNSKVNIQEELIELKNNKLNLTKQFSNTVKMILKMIKKCIQLKIL